MAEIRGRAEKRLREDFGERQEGLESAIRDSIAQGGEAVSVDEAIALLDSFFETGKAPTRTGLKSQRQ